MVKFIRRGWKNIIVTTSFTHEALIIREFHNRDQPIFNGVKSFGKITKNESLEYMKSLLHYE